MTRALGVALAGVILLGLSPNAQQSRDKAVRITLVGSGTISGSVVLAQDDGQPPLRRATVTLTRQGIEDIRTTATDDAGRYVFTDLPAGTYILAAGRGGYLTRSHGAPRSGLPGQAIVLADGQGLTLPPLAIARGGVIAGRVIDRLGQPAPNLGVQVAQIITVNGERRRRPISGGSGPSGTNQHGEYRVYGLQPGSYIVFATPASGVRGTELVDTTPEEIAWAQRREGPAPKPAPALMYVPTLFPGVANASAARVIELGPGQERTDVNFALQHVTVGQIRGVALGPDGSPIPGVRVARRSSDDSPLLPIEMPAVVTDGSGRFVMTNVAPGTYTLGAISAPSASQMAGLIDAVASNPSMQMPQILVGEEVAAVAPGGAPEVSIRLQPAPSVLGTVVVRGSVKAEGAIVTLVPPGPSLAPLPPTGVVNASGQFRIHGVPPGSYRLRVVRGLPPGVQVLSALAGDVDTLDAPVEVRLGASVVNITVTITDVPTSLSGRLVDGTGAPVSSLSVMAFSANRAHWLPGARRVVPLRAGADGSFVFDSLPPGDYYLCALTEIDPALQYEPSFLDELVPASVRVTLKEGQTLRQDLRVGGR